MALSTMLISCNLKDFLKDDDGNDVPLIRLDMPKFDATYLLQFVDATTGEPIYDRFTARISGPSAGDIIDDGGKLNNSTYEIKSGVLSLNLNPNIKLNGSKDIQFAVSGEGASLLVLPQIFANRTPGNKTYSVAVFKFPPIDIRSSPSSVSKVEESLATVTSPSGVTLKPIADISTMHRGDGYDYVKLYRATESGQYNYTAPDVLGVTSGLYSLGESALADPEQKLYLNAGQYFTTISKNDGTVSTDVTINIASNSTISSTFDYIIETDNGMTYRGAVSGKLPISVKVENVYVNNLAKGLKVTLPDNSIFRLSPNEITIPDARSGSAIANFTANLNQSANLDLYNLIINAICASDRMIQFAITKRFQYSLVDPQNPTERQWVDGYLTEGSTSIYMERDKRYDFRIMLNNQWESYEITTNPAEINNILNSEYITKYKMVSSGGVTTIEAEVTSEEICDIQ